MERVTDGTETSIGLPEIRKRSRVKKILEKMMKYKEVLCILLTSVIVFLSRTGQRCLFFKILFLLDFKFFSNNTEKKYKRKAGL